VLLVSLEVVSFGASWAVWWVKIRPARLYRGYSQVTFDRYGEHLKADLYDPSVRRWIWVARILGILTVLMFFPAFLAVAA
jgi:hypothetical protein